MTEEKTAPHGTGDRNGADTNISNPGGVLYTDLMKGIGKVRDREWIAETLAKQELKPGQDVPKLEAVVSYKGVPICTRGSISLFIGAPKGGKSTALMVFAAAVLVGMVGELQTETGGGVLVFDLEQGRYYASLALGRLVDLTEENGLDNLKYYDLRAFSPEDRLTLMRAAIEQYRPSFVIVDGIADICVDYNSPAESSETVLALMQLSADFNCHIATILHRNKGINGDAKGHLGAQAQQKAEITMTVDNAAEVDGVFLVECKMSRGPKVPSFAISRDAQGRLGIIPPDFYTSAASGMKPRSTAPDLLADDVHTEVLRKVLGTGEMRRGELIAGLKPVLSTTLGLPRDKPLGDRAVEKYIEHYMFMGWVGDTPEKRGSKYNLYRVGNLPRNAVE